MFLTEYKRGDRGEKGQEDWKKKVRYIIWYGGKETKKRREGKSSGKEVAEETECLGLPVLPVQSKKYENRTLLSVANY